ncbi:MAG: hypothetical protein A3F11_11780 [Gammaproteobacteria bacterium RIFCSPHIGHO2_12_FULL_37_14]|nr:MAG: hypothetical protein A3F11_11780 [Gammaproteobacteria bacterium RIFCSPHIGHO2_12_FULL_37_14]
MRWQKRSNLIIVIILSFAFTIATLLNIIGPLHTDATGKINTSIALSIYSFIYFIVSLSIIWGLYFYLKNKPKLLFYLLIILGIIIIIIENFLWGWMGS